ncbi:uncharacterized protein LOC114437847 [Parambassis ranga]|uniref:Uncharacterized protein LOC114437847 n=1 Tax=Parambassis ranga TaxID=210632 RepID=A0A6P7IIK0_9TELE|nr:uncharacterized protein LOC114437847 [Parambassis ranga]
MEEDTEGSVSRASLPLSALRLLVPPVRLVSAAVWQTIQQKLVLDYGLLEEFVSLVTDIVPGLLSARHRAELILGLRARVRTIIICAQRLFSVFINVLMQIQFVCFQQILELCRLEHLADFDNVQPHLDRMQMLIEAWVTEAGDANTDVTQSNFVDLVQNLLKSPEEREHYFQKVFPEEFGPTYDDALHTLMWLFLSRLETFLPPYTFQQVASMFVEVSSVLEDCMQSVSSQFEGLRILLLYQKGLSQLDDSESSFDGGCIISALKFPTVGRTESFKAQDNISKAAASASEKDLLNLPPAAQIQTDTTTEHQTFKTETNWTCGRNEDATRQKTNVNLTSQAEDASSRLKECHVQIKRLDVAASLHTRPVRQNRGQRIKEFLLEEKRGICESASRKSFRARPSSCIEDCSYMAPISASSEDDSLSDYSDEGSHHSQSVCSGDESVNGPAEGDSFSSCSGKDSSLQGSKTVPSAGTDVKCQKKIREVQCFMCKESINTSLSSHMELHFPTGDYACPQCGRRFKLLKSFKQHVIRTRCDYTQQHVIPTLYKCDKCEETVGSKVSLQKHKLTHNELYCSVCRKVLQDAATLDRHKASHTPFQCNRCDESFTLFKPLLRHCENIHKISPPFKCSHCPRTLPQLRLLVKHEWQHTGHLPFQCAQCSARFRSDIDLLSHQRVHTREKPYPCAECGRTFAHKCNLLRHFRVIHSKARNERKHSCSQCEKSFKEKGALKIHVNKCHVQMKRHDVAASLHTRPVRQNRGKRIKEFLLEEKRGICESASRKSLRARPSLSDNKDSGSCIEDCSDTAPITASNEDDSLSNYSDEDSSLQGSKIVPSAGTDVKCQKKIREVQCFICKEPVNTSLSSHMELHFPTGDYACPQCGRRFKLLTSFKQHVIRTCCDYSQQHVIPEKPDERTTLYKCDKCEETFRYKVLVKKHKLTHNELYCSVCRKVLRDAATLDRHKASHTPFQCNRCDESFTLFKPLLRHCENIHKISPPFKCSHCPRTLPQLRLLVKHEWQHTGHLPFQCAQCSARFRSDIDLLSHQRVHTREKPYLCAECGKIFAHKCNLLRHFNLIHGEARNEKKHSCSQCEKSFKEKGALKMHQRKNHLNELFRNPCPYCGKMVSSSTMARHKLMHTGERPFKCTVPECDRYFRSTSEVKRHVLLHHTTDRPYTCDVCGKGFINLWALNTHAKIHSGEKPFACHICGKAFLKVYSMLRHKKLVHTKVTQCPSLPLSTLRLLVPPIRLVSAAIWQTVEQKIVSDYGLLEEFVFVVTEIVPQLLSTRQRAELILGLRARLILELCRSDETADLQIIQPHLDRMQNLRSLWNMEADADAEQDAPDSHFTGLVQNLMRDPEERRNFFQDVFPNDFGPTYDKAIQTLMWLFLSRLEKLLPSRTLQQIASLLSDASSVLNECMDTFGRPQELKALLDSQKDPSQLEDIESCIVDSGILSALCFPPMERVVIVNEQTETDSSPVYTVCTEMEVESENKEVYVAGTANSECVQTQWIGLSGEVKAEMDAEVVTDPTEGAEASEGEMAEDHHEEKSGTLIIGEDGQVTVLDGVEKKPNRRGRKKKRPADEDFVVESSTRSKNDDPEFDVLWERPVRKNRGLKMKRYLSQWRKSGKTQGTNATNSGPKKFAKSKSSATDLDERTCKVCGKVVSHAKFLPRHMSQHSEELPISCPVCKKFYKSLRYLQQHKCTSLAKEKSDGNEQESEADKGEQSSSGVPGEAPSEDQPTDSNQDPDYSPSASKEPGQEDKSVLEGPFYCPHCSVEFKCKQTFRFHLRNICYSEQQVDPERPEDIKHCFMCNECDKAFKYKSTLDSHKQTHNPLYCEVCMKLVRDSEALAMHKESHTPFQCNRCEEHFPVFKALHKHYIDVHNPTEPYTCSHCQTTFASLKRFIRHEWKHTGYQPFQCPHCSKRFRSYSDLVEHQKKHTKAYPFLCWECGKKFRHGVTLTRHVERVHHSGEPVTEKPSPTFTCAQCGKTFTSRRCLLKHDNFHHKGLRFPCEHCGKGFFGKDALVRHTLIHTGERPFKCDDCEKSFRSAAELKIHRRYHTGERPFKCNICEKGFVQSCFLTLHMRTHTGERPYVCTVCSKGFSSLHGLKRHRRLVHA